MLYHLFKFNSVAIIASVGLHVALIVFFLGNLDPKPPVKTLTTPSFVKAKLVKLKASQQQPEKAKDKPKVVDLAKKRKEQQRLKAVAQQKKREIQQKNQADKKKAEADRVKKEQLKAQEAADRLRQEQLRQQQEQEALDKAWAEDQAKLLEASYAETAQSYIGAIHDRIASNWSRPPSARNGMSCELQLKLVPTGRIINVDITQSSGNALFDRSAIQAVKKIDQIAEIKNMPLEVFERYYRDLTLVFTPQDLRQ